MYMPRRYGGGGGGGISNDVMVKLYAMVYPKE